MIRLVVALMVLARDLGQEVQRLREPPFEPGTFTPGEVTRGPLQFRSGLPEGQRPARKAPKARAHKAKKSQRRERKKVDRRHSGG